MLLIRNVRPMAGEPADILVEDGRISRIAAGIAADGVTVEDGGGRIAIPGLVEAHTHLDKSLLGHPWYRNEVGPTIEEMIDNERRLRVERGIDSHQQSARVARQMIAAGTTHVRTFVDIDTDIGLTGLEGVLRTRQDLANAISIQICAFPQSGMLIRPGTVELLEVHAGILALDVGGNVHHVPTGGAALAATDRDHAYACAGAEAVRWTMAVYEPQPRRAGMGSRERRTAE